MLYKKYILNYILAFKVNQLNLLTEKKNKKT